MVRQIQRAVEADIPRIREIYAEARRFMAANGNPTQWTDGYPREEQIRRDLKLEQLYVCREDGRIVGVFCYFLGNEPDYREIFEGAWLQDSPYGVVHRIAVVTGSRGVGSDCLHYAFSRCGNLRIDTHRDNIPMQKLLAKNGFQRCGIIYLTKDGSERIAYQKTQ